VNISALTRRNNGQTPGVGTAATEFVRAIERSGPGVCLSAAVYFTGSWVWVGRVVVKVAMEAIFASPVVMTFTPIVGRPRTRI
jgi:hypothetical protein